MKNISKTDYHFLQIHHKEKDDPFLGLRLVEFNATDLCNRQCIFCPHVDPIIFPNNNTYMDAALVQSVVDDLVSHNYRGGIVFSGFGEPTLNKNICNLIKIASKHFPVQMFTNGDKVIDNSWYTIEDFVEVGLQSMYVGIYDNEYQFIKWMKKAHQYKKLLRIEMYKAYEKKLDYPMFINRAGHVLNKKCLPIPCFLPHTKAFIDLDGSLLTCANDWGKTGGFGNVLQTPFSSLWKGDGLNQIRKTLMINRNLVGGPCASCNEQNMGVDTRPVEVMWKPFLKLQN